MANEARTQPVTDSDPPHLTPVSEEVAALIERGIAVSLGELDRTLARWKAGELTVIEAHEGVMRYVDDTEALVKRIMDDAADATSSETENPALPDKKSVIDDLLSRGPVLIHFDARRSDVRVPPRFRSESKLVLRFGYALTPPIRDLIVDDEGVSGTLTFGGVPFGCFLPWAAVFAAVIDGDQRGMVWPDDIPEELLHADPDTQVPDGNAGAEVFSESDDVTPAPSPRSKRPTHLKLVE